MVDFVSIGSLGSGNSEAHVSDINVYGAKFYGTTNGLRIKTWQVFFVRCLISVLLNFDQI